MSCDTPLTIKVPEGYFDPVDKVWSTQAKVPCGKCLSCKKKRVNQWAFRLMQERKVSYSAYFVTLTYNTDYVPITKRGMMTLVKTTLQSDKLMEIYHKEKLKYKKVGKKTIKYFESGKECLDLSVQGFIKRLRYYEEENRRSGRISLTQYKRSIHTTAGPFSNKKLGYYAAGEYGSKRFRPHSHLIIFNLSDIEDIKKAWPYGECHIDEVNQNTIEYTLKYICKPPTEKRPGFDGIPEFSLMSKGLGLSYFTPDAQRFHKQDYANYVVNQRGIKVPIPRYYNNRRLDSGAEIITKMEKEKKALYMANEYEKRNEEERRIAKKYGYNYDEMQVKIAMANKEKLKKPIKERGND